VTWPYYLRDLSNQDQIYDWSQGASGSNHIFTSTINEIENNTNINKDNTLVIIMWSGLSRVDVVAKTTYKGYNYFDDFVSLPLLRYDAHDKIASSFDQLCVNYHRFIDVDAQIIVSATKILALYDYLKNKGFNFLFLTWEKTTMEFELSKIPNSFADAVWNKFNNIKTLGEYATDHNLRIPNDGHPSPDAHLMWTREHLIPHLESLNYIQKLK
jgi:hypothetical protein